MAAATTLLDYIFTTFWKDYPQYIVAKEKFSKLSLDDRFRYFYNILKKKNCLPDIKVESTKSASKAAELKKLGDQAFCENRDLDAVKFYTKSVAVALPTSSTLASAYANRSAALYRLQAYLAALIDINRALNGNYPTNLKLRLQERKLKCIKELQSPHQPLSSFLAIVQKLAITMDVSQGIPGATETTFQFDSNLMEMNYQRKFPVPPEHHPKPTKVPFISKKVKIKHNSQFGRHIVALDEIKSGKTVGIENAFASALDLKYKYSHCANCYVRSESLFPCSTCSLLMFCCEKCQKTAYNRYHRVECEILSTAEYFDIKDDIWLAVRMLMIVTNQGEKLQLLMKHPVYKNPMSIDPSYIPKNFDTRDYANIHHLEDNAAKAPFEENYILGFTSALLVHILKHSTFFDEKVEPGKTKISTDLWSKECYVGSLLFKFLFVIKHNAFKIEESIRVENLSKEKFEINIVEIGSSIYIFHSYFNHSCEGNVAKCSHKDAVVSRTTQPVNVGEQIFLNYGMNYAKTPRMERQYYFQNEYKFTCNCQACKFDWPLINGNADAATNPKLKRTSIKLESLEEVCERARILRQIHSVLYDKMKYEHLCNQIDTFHKSIKKPWKEYYDCQEKLKEVFAITANYYSKETDGIVPLL